MSQQIASTDSRGRLVLSGHRSETFLVTENPDGSVLLTPGSFVTNAQREYDSSPELQDLLARAAESPTIARKRPRRG